MGYKMMVRKKVFIAMDTMLCGGIEKSVLSLLYALSPDEVKVTLCLDRMSGEFYLLFLIGVMSCLLDMICCERKD